MKLHHRGSKMLYHTPVPPQRYKQKCFRGCYSFSKCSALFLPKKKKIAAAIYEYQADCDGEWGEIQFDFEAETTEIVRLADWDTTISNVYAKKAIEIILESYKTQLPKEMMEAFGRD